MSSLQDRASPLLLRLPCEECGTSGVLKDLPDTFVGLGRALEVLLSADLLTNVFGLQACKVSIQWRPLFTEKRCEYGDAPARGSPVFAKSCAALQLSSGHI